MRFLSVQSPSMIGLGYNKNEFWYQVYGILSKLLSDNAPGLRKKKKKMIQTDQDWNNA